MTKSILIRTILFLSMLFPSFSYADGPRLIQGTNIYGEEVRIFMDSVDVRQGKNKQSYENEPCGFLSGPAPDKFRCESNGKSPMAGTTYVVTKELTKCRGTLLACIKGCSPRVPRVLIMEPWECRTPAVEPYIEPCAPNNSEKVGITTINGVNLREQPDLSAQVLLRLEENTKVTILERRNTCLTIDYEQGQWIKVEVPNGSAPLVGWVFDAYVEYPPYFYP